MWKMEYGGVKNGFFTRNLFIDPDIDMIHDHAKRYFNNRDMFHTIYLYEDVEDITNSNIKGPFMIDLDGSIENNRDFQRMVAIVNLTVATLEESLSVKENNIRIYFSGNKGFHLAINQSVLGLESSKDLNITYKKIAESVKNRIDDESLDMKIYDKRRLIRVVNSIHSKTGLHKVIIPLEKLNKMTMQDMKEYASSPKKENKGNYNDTGNVAISNSLTKLLNSSDTKVIKKNKTVIKNNRGKIKKFPCLVWLLENGASEGERNNASVALSSVLLQNGYSKDDTYNLVLGWNEDKNEPPLPSYEILATVNSAYQMLESGKAFGCNKLSEVSECNQECELYNQQN